MNNTLESLVVSLVDAMEHEDDSLPVGYELESTVYTVTVTLQSAMVRANMLEVA